MHDMGALISTEEPAHSVSGAEALLVRHNEHKAEVDAREESLAQITKNGKKLIQQNHYASSEVCVYMDTSLITSLDSLQLSICI